MEVVIADTNVVVRLLVKDNDRQTAAAKKIFASHLVYLPWSVILECEWVLRSLYGFEAEDFSAGFLAILSRRNVEIDEVMMVFEALQRHREGFDFADALHYVSADGLELKTFDRNFIKKAKKVGWKVSLP